MIHPGGGGLLASRMPTLLTTSFLAGVTTSGRSRTSLAQELTCLLSTMSLAHQLAQKMSSTSKIHEPDCHTSLSYSRERSRLLAPATVANGAQMPTRAMTHCLSLHCPPPSSPTGQEEHSPTNTPLTLGESAALAACLAMDQRSLQCMAYTMSEFSLGFADANQ
jgi:hypothetical protein